MNNSFDIINSNVNSNVNNVNSSSNSSNNNSSSNSSDNIDEKEKEEENRKKEEEQKKFERMLEHRLRVEQAVLEMRKPKPPNTYPEVDGDYLLDIMPNEIKEPIKKHHLDTIESKCIEYMKQKAKEGKFSCEYFIPAIFPGLPSYDQTVVMRKLRDRLLKRKNLFVNIHPRKKYHLIISWDPLVTGNKNQLI